MLTTKYHKELNILRMTKDITLLLFIYLNFNTLTINEKIH